MTRKQHDRTTVIPKFFTLEDEAKFWDSHDTADYATEFRPIDARFNRALSEGITIRFDTETLNQVRLLAGQKGIGPTTLARMWILERLRRETSVTVDRDRR